MSFLQQTPEPPATLAQVHANRRRGRPERSCDLPRRTVRVVVQHHREALLGWGLSKRRTRSGSSASRALSSATFSGREGRRSSAAARGTRPSTPTKRGPGISASCWIALVNASATASLASSRSPLSPTGPPQSIGFCSVRRIYATFWSSTVASCTPVIQSVRESEPCRRSPVRLPSTNRPHQGPAPPQPSSSYFACGERQRKPDRQGWIQARQRARRSEHPCA